MKEKENFKILKNESKEEDKSEEEKLRKEKGKQLNIEKIAKLILEKKKLEEKQNLKGDLDQSDTPQIQDYKFQIKKKWIIKNI